MGFEFRQENLENVTQAMLKFEDEVIRNSLRVLAERHLIVPVAGESVDKILKFSHQIITESAYNLMLDSQRREVHKAIALDFESSSKKFDIQILAYHWLRSGNIDKGTTLLQNAAHVAIEIGAYKEAVNNLSECIAVDKENSIRALWYAMMGYARIQNGQYIAYGLLCLQGVHELGDPEFLP